MPMWRCPHCGTPQAEAARCWVCRRSSTACGSCRHFRRSVAAQLGYCGLDRQRRPLGGDEIRACWEGATVSPSDHPAEPVRPVVAPSGPPDRTDVRRLEFVPVPSAPRTATEPARPRRRSRPASTPAAADLPPGSAVDARWSLWGEPEA